MNKANKNIIIAIVFISFTFFSFNFVYSSSNLNISCTKAAYIANRSFGTPEIREQNFGANTNLKAGLYANNEPERILMHCNMTDYTGFTISAARLWTYIHDIDVPFGDGTNITIYNMSHEWNEGTGSGTWNSNAVNGSTWYEYCYNNNSWTGNETCDWDGIGASLDYNNELSGIEVTYAQSNEKYFNWTIKSDVVQSWIGTPESNFGLLFKSTEEDSEESRIQMYSDDDSTRYPMLEITFTESVPPNYEGPINNASTTTQYNGFVNFSINVSDTGGLDNITVNTNITGNWHTWTDDIGGTSYSYYFINQTNATNGNYLCTNFTVRDGSGNENSTDYTCFTVVDTTNPSITIIKPEVAEEFSNNESIPLNHSIYDVSGISFCWFSVNGGDNETISSCTNTTFNTTTDGNFNLRLCANDTVGNEDCLLRNFAVSLTAPAITLEYPSNNTYLDIGTNFWLNYTATDINGIDSCQIWTNITGVWTTSANQTPVSGVENGSQTNATDGPYLWNVWCEDSTAESRFSTYNFTFTVDTTYPTLDLITLTTTAGSQTVGLTVVDYNETNCDTAFYSVYNSSGGIENSIENETMSCSSLTDSFTVGDYATYNITVWMRDKAGNENFTKTQFTTSAITGGVVTGGGGSSVTTTECDLLLFRPQAGKPIFLYARAEEWSNPAEFTIRNPGEAKGTYIFVVTENEYLAQNCEFNHSAAVIEPNIDFTNSIRCKVDTESQEGLIRVSGCGIDQNYRLIVEENFLLMLWRNILEMDKIYLGLSILALIFIVPLIGGLIYMGTKKLLSY